ncbi:MAG: glycosyltransferase, partial [Thermodesulfobacteriota bacterium]
AIESAINQNTNVPFEVVVVDNETDPAMAEQVDELVRSFGCKHLHLYRNEQNIGMFGNWNRCISLARGEWISILNDDDRLHREYVDTVLTHTDKHKMIGVRSHMIGTPPNPPLPIKVLAWLKNLPSKLTRIKDLDLADLMIANPFMGSLGILYHTESLKQLGGFSEKYWPSSDYVLNTRYTIKHGARLINKKLSDYRWETNASQNPKVLAGFITTSHTIRQSVIGKKPGAPRGALKLISSLQFHAEANLLEKKLANLMNEGNNLTTFGLGHKKIGIFGILIRKSLATVTWKLTTQKNAGKTK